MDASTLTHIAAIVLGIGLTLFFVKSFQGNDAVAATNGGVTSKSTRKRKKKKSKAAKTEEPKLEERSTPVQTKEKAEQQSTAVPALEGAKAKKKKKKKKSETKSKPTNVASETASEKEKETTAAEEEETPPPPQKPKVQQQKSEPKWEKTKVVEEEWGVVAGPKKKNRNSKPKKTAQTSTVPAASESVTVDAKKIGIIIGPKGATMKALEEATGCKLDINAPSKDDPPPKGNQPQKAGIILSGGDKQAMAKAKKAILELATKGYTTLLQSGNFGEFGTMVHPRCLSEIVGPGGRTIQAIQSALDVKLTIPSTDWKPNAKQVGQVKLCKVGIAGSKQNAQEAKAVITSLIRWHYHAITHPGFIHEQVYVPQEFFHCVIGRGGSEIKHIRGNY